MTILADPSAERAVLAGICRYNGEAYFDIADILGESTFTIDTNAVVFKCVKQVLEHNQKAVIDLPSILSAAHELGFSYVFQKKDELLHLRSIMEMPIVLANVRRFAGKIRKLEIARLLRNQLSIASEKLLETKGDEPITQILSVAEDTIFDFTSLLNDKDDKPELLLKGIQSYLDYLAENPVEMFGISTGFPLYDASIGGGLRNGTVNVIAARPKAGKTTLGDNIGVHISKNLSIPVLNLDTEMNNEDHKHKIMAMLSDVKIHDIETGRFGKSEVSKSRLQKAAKEVDGEKTIPFFYKAIPGKSFEEQLAIMRRWIVKEVGLNTDGTAKPCVIIYDYLKLMTAEGVSNDMKEYQLLGFMMTALTNFANRYKVPVLTFIQLNRDGITKETTDAASGSDRIIWFCSNFSIYKFKSDEEIAEDGTNNGNRKLVPVIARHGAGLPPGEYINMHMQGEYGRIIEGRLRSEVAEAEAAEEGFVVEEDEESLETSEYDEQFEAPFDG